MNPNSRKYPRFAVQAPVVFGEGTERREGTLLNLSVRGCALTSERLPTVPAYISLQMAFLNDAEPIDVELAAVRWTTAHRCGLEFIRISPEMDARLRAYVAQLEHNSS